MITKYIRSASALLLATLSVAAAAAIDCPLRDQPYSIDTPLMDLLLNPRAMAAVESIDASMGNMPPQFRNPAAPSFSAILTLRTLSSMRKTSEENLAALDKALAAVIPTEEEKNARCERYDNDVPNFEQPKGKPRVLLFEKVTGFRDSSAIAAMHAMVTAMAARKGWSLVTTDKGGAINSDTLKKFDVVIWNNISGDVLTLTQRRALVDYMEKGGGFVGVHGAGGDPVYFWDWYADTLLGARFLGHPLAPQFQDARVTIETSPSGIGKDLAPGWTMNDEWYSFGNNPRATGAQVIATLDESTYSPVGIAKQDLRMGADHPIAWTRCINNGRAFYSAIGHRPEVYADPHQIKLIEQAIVWAAGSGQSKCVNGKEIK